MYTEQSTLYIVEVPRVSQLRSRYSLAHIVIYGTSRDVTSEYPSAIIIGNISSETLVGRVFLEGELPVISIPEVYEFRGDEAAKYKMDVSNFMLEQYSERDYLSFCHTFLNLPTFSEVCEMIDNNII